MEILYVLLVLLLATRTLGELAVRVGQPALVGEILAGILLGVVVGQYAEALPTLAHLQDDSVFTAITDLGIFFLMLLAGVELRAGKLARSSLRAVWVALGGLALPLALGVALALYFLPSGAQQGARSLFVGVALAITAVPVSVGVLVSLGKLDTPVGRTIVSAAIFDDVLSLLLLAVLTAVLETGGVPDLATLGLLGAKVMLFFVVSVPVGLYVFPFLGSRIKRLHAAEFEFSFLLVSGLAFSVLAELLSMHFLIGAFLAGLFFGRSTVGEDVYDDVFRKVNALTSGFLAPIFFASIGLHLETGALLETPVFVLVLIATATIGKVIGAGLPARVLGLGTRDAFAVGMGMNARGAVELIVADVALRAGLFETAEGAAPSPYVASLYSAIVITAIATTLATPIALERFYRARSSQECEEVDDD